MRVVYFVLFHILKLDFWFRWANRKKVTIISYHNPSYAVLEKHLSFLVLHYNFITIDDFCNKPKAQTVCNALILTFDDGYKQNVELLPLFVYYKVKPVIYCCSDVVASNHVFWDGALKGENPNFYKKISNAKRLFILEKKGLYTPWMEDVENQGLSKEDIAVLDQYVTWGSHTKTHVILPQCSLEEKKEEIIGSKTQLESILGKRDNWHFAYPSGCYDEECVDILKKAGYRTARTTDAGWNDGKTNPYKLKVIGISDNADMLKFRFQITGLSMWLQYLRHGSLFGKNKNFIMKK